MYNEEWLNRKISQSPNFAKAFTHRSYLNEISEKIESNERLEFLGDSVLSLIISTYLYNKRLRDTEGELTNLRSYIVKTPSLAMASKKLKIGQYLRLSKGEEISGGRENTQLLANTFEALLGAIYLDEGFEESQKFVEEILLPLFEKEITTGPPKDSKSLLQELTQFQTKQSPRYKILQTKGPDHAKSFTVGVFMQGKQVGQGEGLSKQEAEESAASQALEFLSKQS